MDTIYLILTTYDRNYCYIFIFVYIVYIIKYNGHLNIYLNLIFVKNIINIYII